MLCNKLKSILSTQLFKSFFLGGILFFMGILLAVAQEESMESSRIKLLNKSIQALTNAEFEWSNYEVILEDSVFTKQLDLLAKDSKFQFYYPAASEEGPMDVIPFHKSNMHFLDYNGDGFNDLIYEQLVTLYAGHQVKFIRWNSKEGMYQLDYEFEGRVVGIDPFLKQSEKQFDFQIHTYPCCDGYIQTVQDFSLVFKDLNAKPALNFLRKQTIVQSNLSHKPELPSLFVSVPKPDEHVTLKEETPVYFHSKRPLYHKLQIAVDSSRQGCQILGVLKAGVEIVLKSGPVDQRCPDLYLAAVAGQNAFSQNLKLLFRRTQQEHRYKLTPKVDEYFCWVSKASL